MAGLIKVLSESRIVYSLQHRNSRNGDLALVLILISQECLLLRGLEISSPFPFAALHTSLCDLDLDLRASRILLAFVSARSTGFWVTHLHLCLGLVRVRFRY